MQSFGLLYVAVAVLAVLTCTSWQARAAVISIDFGGEWIKAALVKVSSDIIMGGVRCSGTFYPPAFLSGRIGYSIPKEDMG